MSADYLKLTPAQRLYLTYFATGMPTEQIVARLPNEKTGGLGVDSATVARWRIRSPLFAEYEQHTYEDPKWFHREVMVPLKIAAFDTHDMEGMMGVGGKAMRFSSKDRELILQEAGHLGADQSALSGYMLDLFKNLRRETATRPSFDAPTVTVIDVPAHSPRDEA